MSTQQGQEETKPLEISPYGVGERDIDTIIADLSKPVHPSRLSSKTVGGQKILYVSWHMASKILDYKAPGWTWEIPHPITSVGGRAAMVGRLGIPANLNGQIIWFYRDASGSEDEEVDKYGDPTSNSESMALRRAAAKFGLCRNLYGGQQSQPQAQGAQGHPESSRQAIQRAGTQQTPAAGSSRAPSTQEPGSVTPKQLGMIRGIAAEKGRDENAESIQLFGYDAPELTVKQASELIKHLQSLPNF